VRAKLLAAVACLLTVVGALVAAFAPLGSATEISGSPGKTTVTHTSPSLFQTEGAWILIVVSVPVLMALVPMVARHRRARTASAVLLWIGCVVGMLSIGMFFVPAAIAMTVAATRREPDPVPPMPSFRT
jgi:hypothetical protein